MKPVNAFANIFGPIGYAHHARKFFSALNKIHPLCLVPKYGQLPPEAFEADFQQMLSRLNHVDLNAVSINLDYAEEMMHFSGKIRIGYTVFETQKLSPMGINLLKQLDHVWVPTHWGKKVLEENGVAKVAVVPEGVDTALFAPDVAPYPELAALDGYRFLSVGKWEERKGIKEVLRSFDQAFMPEDKVYLVLYYPNHVTALKKVDVIKEVDLMNLKNRSKIIIIESTFESEQEMARLYATCHAYVSGSKAEGWGLPITEAMASGLCVVAPYYSGPTEYLTPENSVPLEISRFEDVYCPVFFPNKGEFGCWASIDSQVLAQKLRWIFAHQDEARQIGRQAALDMKTKWTWDMAAQKAAVILNSINASTKTFF